MKTKIQSWEVSDLFWEKVKPLIPKRKRITGRKYLRKSGGGRKAIDPRRIFEGVVYVLRTGIRWKALPKERFGAASSVHGYFREWLGRGFFLKLWKKGLMEYDEMEGVAWKWQSIDGSMVKAPLAQEAVGGNPTDRGKKRDQKKHSRGRAWHPALNYRDRSERS